MVRSFSCVVPLRPDVGTERLHVRTERRCVRTERRQVCAARMHVRAERRYVRTEHTHARSERTTVPITHPRSQPNHPVTFAPLSRKHPRVLRRKTEHPPHPIFPKGIFPAKAKTKAQISCMPDGP